MAAAKYGRAVGAISGSSSALSSLDQGYVAGMWAQLAHVVGAAHLLTHLGLIDVGFKFSDEAISRLHAVHFVSIKELLTRIGNPIRRSSILGH